MEKICKKHGLTEFVLRKDGHKRCKKCAVEAVQKRRDKLKIMAVEYKGGKCVVCGYKKYVGALEFHHLIPDTKDFGIGSRGYTRSWKMVKMELDKCVIVCANCHREIHGGLLNTFELNPNNHINIEETSNTNYCIDCGKIIDKDAKRCIECHLISVRKVERPSYNILVNEINENGYSATGRKYGVSDNSIRKWLKFYEKYEL